jgi:hypothetical protein
VCNLYSITTNQAAILALPRRQSLRRQPVADARVFPTIQLVAAQGEQMSQPALGKQD